MAKSPKDKSEIESELDELEAELGGEPDDAPDFNTVLADEAPPSGRTGPNLGFIFFLFLLASLVGGAIGWIGPKLNAAPDPVAALAASHRTQFSELTDALAQEQEKVAALQSALDSTKRALSDERAATRAQADTITDLTTRLQSLEERVPDAETLKTEREALDKRLSSLENLKVLGTKDKDGKPVAAGALMDRIDALEAAQAAESEAEKSDPEALATLQAEVEALQNQLNTAPTFPEPDTEPIKLPKVQTPYDRNQALQILIDTYPRDKMVEAVRAQEKLAEQRPSWLKRVISRHVQVGNETEEPIAIIDSIEKNIREDNIDTALEQISTLNPPVRAIAADWIKSAKKFQKSEL